MKLERKEDAQYKPFSLHMARCCQWPPGADDAFLSGRSKPTVESQGYFETDV